MSGGSLFVEQLVVQQLLESGVADLRVQCFVSVQPHALPEQQWRLLTLAHSPLQVRCEVCIQPPEASSVESNTQALEELYPQCLRQAQAELSAQC